jgi:hypothetical protein
VREGVDVPGLGGDEGTGVRFDRFGDARNYESVETRGTREGRTV